MSRVGRGERERKHLGAKIPIILTVDRSGTARATQRVRSARVRVRVRVRVCGGVEDSVEILVEKRVSRKKYLLHLPRPFPSPSTICIQLIIATRRRLFSTRVYDKT